MSEVNAYVTVENGQVILHDPAAEGVIAAIEAHNRGISYEKCQKIFELNAEGIERFKRRFTEKGYDPKEYCIVIVQVDSPYGGPISDILMPGHDWQAVRNQGMEPIARGIADREFMRGAIAQFDQRAAEKNNRLKDDLVVIVVADRVARVFGI